MKPEQEDYVIATYDIDINGSKSKVIIKGTGGVPDRNFDKKTNEKYRHQFVYLPVTVTANDYNRTWLNYNLGAAYADTNTPHFNLNVKKTDQAAHDDENLYGSLYQWQRASDGHEFRDSEKTSFKADTWRKTGKAARKFITGGANWVANRGNASDLQLWQAGGDNNPCPLGYHVPTEEEWNQLLDAVGSNNKIWSQDLLPNLAAAGFRDNSNPRSGGTGGNYWSSTNHNSNDAKNIGFNNGKNYPNYHFGRSYGISVRCIKSN